MARYGLGVHLEDDPASPPTKAEQAQIDDLSRAGRRLIGFCRTNLFKRLESSGSAFLQSVERHVLRNYVFLHAIRNGYPLPIGTQDAEMLDSRFTDEDADEAKGERRSIPTTTINRPDIEQAESTSLRAAFKARAADVYSEYESRYKSRFKWLRPDLFKADLERELQQDCDALIGILQTYGDWDPGRDTKLAALHALLTETYPRPTKSWSSRSSPTP